MQEIRNLAILFLETLITCCYYKVGLTSSYSDFHAGIHDRRNSDSTTALLLGVASSVSLTSDPAERCIINCVRETDAEFVPHPTYLTPVGVECVTNVTSLS